LPEQLRSVRPGKPLAALHGFNSSLLEFPGGWPRCWQAGPSCSFPGPLGSDFSPFPMAPYSPARVLAHLIPVGASAASDARACGWMAPPWVVRGGRTGRADQSGSGGCCWLAPAGLTGAARSACPAARRTRRLGFAARLAVRRVSVARLSADPGKTSVGRPKQMVARCIYRTPGLAIACDLLPARCVSRCGINAASAAAAGGFRNQRNGFCDRR